MVRILVVEDEESIRTTLVDMLELANHEIMVAVNGANGVKIAQEEIPDLIMSDIMMPVMDGYEFFEAIRQNPETASIPFIFLTALSSYDEVRSGMNLGVDDYLAKPFDYQQLITAVNARLEKQEIIREKERKYEQELEIAFEVQQSIQPVKAPVLPRIQMGFHWQPAKQVGGDAWGWVINSETELSYFILDIAGKGLPAALAAMSLHTALKVGLKMGLSPVEVIQMVNDEFYDSFTQSSLFATVVVIKIDVETGVMTQANAGHLPTLACQQAEGWVDLGATVPPIGVLPQIKPEAQILQLQPSDCIVVYSDGFSEIQTDDGLWGEEGIKSSVPHLKTDANLIVNEISKTAEALSINNQLHDDQTIVVIIYE